MNNPFDLFSNKDAQTEQESYRLKIRTGVLLGLFCGLLAVFLGALFSIQVIHGDEYLNNAHYTVVSTENVTTDRGEITDRNGTVLVSNRISYQVRLDVSLMGADRDSIISQLIALCRESGVEWSDSLPISDTAPWTYTRANPFFTVSTDDEGNVITDEKNRPVGSNTLLGALAKRMKWIGDPAKDTLTAEELLTAMCQTWGVELPDGGTVDASTRELLGVLYNLYLRVYEITYTDYVFADDVDISFITKVKERALPGVTVEPTTARAYSTDDASHVLGHIGSITSNEWSAYKELGYSMDDIVGKDGVELAFEEYLRGYDGTRRIESDIYGNVISESWAVEPDPGDNVVLTLDAAVQAATEDSLAEFVTALEEPAGAAAVMLDMSGGVIAMASYPTYDLSTYYEDFSILSVDEDRPYWNRATRGLYAPGSTYKPMVAVAALSEGTITPKSTVICTGVYQYYAYAGYTPVCWIWTNVRGTHGSMNVSTAITHSCNIFFFDVGRRLGITKIEEYAAQFGLGQSTGIEIGDYKGSVAGPETSAALGIQWYGGDTLPASIGQGNNQFTPVQLANYVATLVNGGNLYQVHLLKEVKSDDYSETVAEYDPVLLNTIEISDANLQAVKKGMYDLSKTNAMKPYFGSLPFEVGCKTGTAEVSGSSVANSVFVCFAPYDDPQVALCIVAEKGANGGSLAKVAADMLAQYFAVEENQTTVDTENTLIP